MEFRVWSFGFRVRCLVLRVSGFMVRVSGPVSPVPGVNAPLLSSSSIVPSGTFEPQPKVNFLDIIRRRGQSSPKVDKHGQTAPKTGLGYPPKGLAWPPPLPPLSFLCLCFLFKAPGHTVEYDSFIKSQLLSRNEMWGFMQCNFAHVTPQRLGGTKFACSAVLESYFLKLGLRET